MSPPFPFRRDDGERPRGAPWRARGAIALLVLAGTLGAAGCATPRAEGLIAGPPLEVPPPPPRVIAPVQLEAISATAGVPPSSAPDVANTTPPAAPPNGNGTRAAVAPPPAAAGQPPPAAATAEPPRELRVVPSAEEAAAEQRLRVVIAAANRDLAQIEYQRLSANAREQYDQARRHLEMAQEAFREKDYTYAFHLAQAGATVASQLVPAR